MATFWRILTLRSQAYQGIKVDRKGFGTTLMIFLAVTLIASAGQLFALRQIAQQKSIYEGLATAAANLEAMAQGRFVPEFISTPLNSAAQWLGQFSQVLEAGQPPLGKQVSQSLITIGGWLASPVGLLLIWLPAAILLFICAKVLGGNGSVREHLSLVLLAIAPQLLTVLGQFSLAPALGALAAFLGVVAVLWSFTILIVALMNAHGFSVARTFGTLALAVLVMLVADAVVVLLWGALTAGVIALLA